MLYLRPYKPCDAGKVVSWIIDEKAFYQWSAGRMGTYPLTEARLNDHYAAEAENPRYWTMTAYDDGGAVGQLIMRLPDPASRMMRFGFIMVDSSKRGKGYGKKMLRLAADYAFTFTEAETITLGVFANNPAARYCYEAVGFEHRPELDTIYPINGEEWLCLEMELTRERFYRGEEN